MFGPNQIVYDRELKKPVKAHSTNNAATHFIEVEGDSGYKVAHPNSCADAQLLLDRGVIAPAPCPPSHCWRCGNWKSNCASMATLRRGERFIECPERDASAAYERTSAEAFAERQRIAAIEAQRRELVRKSTGKTLEALIHHMRHHLDEFEDTDMKFAARDLKDEGEKA